MDEEFFLKFNGTQLWQARIPAHSLQRLKSHAALKLKDFWPDDYGESPGLPHSEAFYSKETVSKKHFATIPLDDQATISLVDCEDEPINGFELDMEISTFQKVEIRHSSFEHYDLIIPVNFKLTEPWTKYLASLAKIDQNYISNIEDIFKSCDGLSSVILDSGGFVAEIPLDLNAVPKSTDDLILITSSGSISSLTFEFLHGLIIKGKFYGLRSFEGESYSDLFHTTYHDEESNLIARFHHWHAGLEVDEIGKLYISEVSDEIIDAYRATNFKVNFDPDFILNIGMYSRKISEIHGQYNCSSSAFITAWNPLGEIVSESENNVLSQLLKSSVPEKYIVIEGVGEDPSGKWQGEESILIVGINREDAMILGRKFRQNAIVFNYDSIPELIMLR